MAGPERYHWSEVFQDSRLGLYHRLQLEVDNGEVIVDTTGLNEWRVDPDSAERVALALQALAKTAREQRRQP